MQGTDKLNTITNIVFVLTDVLETNLLEMQQQYKKEGFELRHDSKRNFNTAIAAIKRLKSDVNHCSESTQENFGNDSDMVNAMLLTLIDRCGDDDNLAYKMYEYIKSFPSKLNLDLDLDNAFSHLFKGEVMKSQKNILKSIEGLSDIELFVIDLFCGAGGLSEGVEEARLDGNRCGKVVCCVNHDKNAILSHDANIPDALHFIEDIRTLELSPISTIVERIRQLYPDAMIILLK